MKGGEMSNVHEENMECGQQQSPNTGIMKNDDTFCTPSTSTGSIYIVRSTTTPLSQGKKYIDIRLLTREHFYLAVDVKCKISDVYRYVCAHIGLNCVQLFGLARYSEDEYRFCDPSDRLSKHASTKNWQKSPGWGTDLVGNPSVILYLRVHTYVDCIRLISCPVSLLHYYLQLRENARIQWEPSWVAEERCFEAAALALQADYGDYQPNKHTMGYFRPDAYFPMWVVNGRGLDYVLRHMPSMHHDLDGLDPYEAQIRYCREVSMPPCPVNMHLYRLRRQKTDTSDTIYLGVTTRGLELFEQKSTGDRQHIASFIWSKIGKLAFDRKKFTLVRLDGQKMVFYTSSDEKSRYLLNFCRAVHQNCLRLQPAIVEARRREAEERKQFRESYIYSDTADLDWIRKIDTQTPMCSSLYEFGSAPASSASLMLNSFPRAVSTSGTNENGAVVVCCGGSGQRVSLVSDASSNTTSGIVSDRQHTHDDSENENEVDPDFEIATGCDSSPLVSELSLSTSGTTPPSCLSGSQHSQQASPNHDQVKDESTRTMIINDSNSCQDDDDDGDQGEGSSSVGPCSDRTVTAAAEDSQSTETTSTTGKLEDFCNESESSGVQVTVNVLPRDEKTPTIWSVDEPVNNIRSPTMQTPSATTPSNFSNVSIAELRRLTLQDYADRQPSFQRRASPPIVPPPQPLPNFVNEKLPISLDVRDDVPQWDLNGNAQLPIDLVQHETMTMNQHGFAWHCTPKAYRIVTSQLSNDGICNGEQPTALDQRSSPTPSRLENLIIEPPPPPPYPYGNGPMDIRSAQSYSLSNLPSSSSSSYGVHGSTPIPEALYQSQRTSVDGLPNYEQALHYKVELGRRLAASTTLSTTSVTASPHTTATKRWPTISGIHPAILDQLMTVAGSRRLQQAQSEPGLAYTDYSAYANYDELCSSESYAAPFSSSLHAAEGEALFDGGISSAYRSVSSHQLATGSVCACRHTCDQQQIFQHPQQIRHPYNQFAYPPQGPVCTPNGLYVKQPRAQARSSAATSAGHRMHAMDCQQLYKGASPNHGSSKAVARVHSMYEAARADQVRRTLDYEYYRRFEQQVVENTRRELRKQQKQMEQALAASLNDSTSSAPASSYQTENISPSGNTKNSHASATNQNDHNHSAPGHFCESCHENHTAGKLDLAQLKDIIRAQNMDLPLMRALCNDQSWNQQESTSDTAIASTVNDSSAHPLLRQKKPFQSRAHNSKPPVQVAKCDYQKTTNNGRPMTWHEVQPVGSSSWPSYEFSYNH